MSNENPISLLISFQDLPDPRVEGRCDHKLINTIVITVCAVIVGAESWVDVESFGKGKQEWLQTFRAAPWHTGARHVWAFFLRRWMLKPFRRRSCAGWKGSFG